MKNLNTLLFLSFGILLLAGTSSAHGDGDHVCVHDDLKVDQVIGMHDEDPTGRHRVLADWAPLRIAADYSNLTSMNATIASYIRNTLFPAAIRWLSSAYKVKQFTTGLKINGTATTCGSSQFKYPSTIIGGNSLPNTDLMVLVTWSNDPSSSWVARASACALDSATLRPYIGFIEFNLYYTKIDEASWAKNLGTLLHEFHHVLFFSSSQYANYYDPTTTNKRVAGLTAKRMIDGVNTTVFVHPKIVAEARNHFGCPTIDHVRIENEGSSGSMGSHWERKWFGNEFITASVGNRMPVSNSTLVLAEVTGWYKSNFAMAESLAWGKGRGCNLLTQPCLTGRETNAIAPLKASSPDFCTTPGSYGCDYENNAAGYCRGGKSSFIPPAIWNYFKDNTYSGDTFSDNCPVMSGYSNRNCADPAASKFQSSETLGPNSACFVSSIVATGYTSAIDGQCYQYLCIKNAAGAYNIEVTAGNTKFTCTFENQQFAFPTTGYKGTLYCPDPARFCQLKAGFCPRGCGGAGTCNKGVCTCNAGRKGPDCLRNA